MRVVVGLPQISADPQAVLDAAREAEEAGAWGVWTFDNLTTLRGPDRAVLDGWALLSLLAGGTGGLRLVSLVTRARIRPPALVARMAAVVQAASGGRLTVGIGAGDRASLAEEHRFGIVAPADRAARLDAVERTVEALRGRGPGPVRPSHDPVPVWIGGAGSELVDLAARVADAWHGWGLSPAAFSERASSLRAHRPGIECWWGGMFDPVTAPGTMRALAEAGADGVTWMIASRHETERRPALLDLIRDL